MVGHLKQKAESRKCFAFWSNILNINFNESLTGENF